MGAAERRALVTMAIQVLSHSMCAVRGLGGGSEQTVAGTTVGVTEAATPQDNGGHRRPGLQL